MKPLKEIEKIVRKYKINPRPEMRSKVLDEALEIQRKLKQQSISENQPHIWGMIMRSKIAKLAAAAGMIIAVVLGITVLEKSATPAWAIEDTIKALENVHSIKMSGIVSSVIENGKKVDANFVLWAKPNEDGTESKELRFDVPGQIVVVDASGKTYFYHPNQNSVFIKDSKNFQIRPWIGSEFFHKIKKLAEKWEISYGKDEDTGKESIFVTCTNVDSSKSVWFQFDRETKLPVRFKQWTNINFTDKPEFYAESIEYNPVLPEGIFEFKIPMGTTVIDIRELYKKILEDPNYGLDAEGLSETEACKAIVQEYWLAVIDQNWDHARRLRSIPLEFWEDWKKSQYEINMPVEIVEVNEPHHDNDHITTSALIKLSDGSIKQSKLMIKFRTINDVNSCVIIGNYGPQELNKIE